MNSDGFRLFAGNNGARTHDLPRVRRTLSRLSYIPDVMKNVISYHTRNNMELQEGKL